MAVHFEINGQPIIALNGGPQFKFNESISFQVNCDTQEEVDYYWEKLSAGADKNSQQCGWLKDQFGVSWQVVPTILPELLDGQDHAGAQRAMKAMLQMKKLDIAKLKQAYAG
jgi:predicted 3-demethylubiquinone-9 3-methyltransferase (glyoxalase superfamily)